MRGRATLRFIRTRSGPRSGGPPERIEAFPFFAVAVLLAEFRGVPQRLIDELAVLFLIVRIAYVFTYLGNRPTLRSILWSVGFAINIAIFFLPAIRDHLPIRDASGCLRCLQKAAAAQQRVRLGLAAAEGDIGVFRIARAAR